MSPIDLLPATSRSAALATEDQPFGTDHALPATGAAAAPGGRDDDSEVQTGAMRIGRQPALGAAGNRMEEAGAGESGAGPAAENAFHASPAVLHPLIIAASAKAIPQAGCEPSPAPRNDHIGVDDSLRYLAMVAGTTVPLLRQPGVARTPLLAIVKARLRARSGRDDDLAATVDRIAALGGDDETGPKDDAV